MLSIYTNFAFLFFCLRDRRGPSWNQYRDKKYLAFGKKKFAELLGNGRKHEFAAIFRESLPEFFTPGTFHWLQIQDTCPEKCYKTMFLSFQVTLRKKSLFFEKTFSQRGPREKKLTKKYFAPKWPKLAFEKLWGEFFFAQGSPPSLVYAPLPFFSKF